MWGGGGGGNSTVCESRDDGYNSQDTLLSGLCWGLGGVGTALYVSPEMMDTNHRTHYNQVCVCGKGWGGVVGTALYVSPEMMDTTHRTHYNQVCVGGGGGDNIVCESRDDGYNPQDTPQSGLWGGAVVGGVWDNTTYGRCGTILICHLEVNCTVTCAALCTKLV